MARKTDLAAQALGVLSASGRRLKSGELAELIGTTTGFVPQVLAPLIERSWVDSEPGPTGGYAASADLDSISVLDVVEAVEGPTNTGKCVLENRTCESGGICALHSAWARARQHLLDDLSETPLSSIRLPTAGKR